MSLPQTKLTIAISLALFLVVIGGNVANTSHSNTTKHATMMVQQQANAPMKEVDSMSHDSMDTVQ